MSQKPIDKRRPEETRQAIWAAIRRLGAFVPKEVRYKTRCSRSQVDEYVACLLAAGIVERVAGEPGRYVLVWDRGSDAPRVRRDGTPVTQGRGRENMWRTMKVLGTFSALELAINASTEEHAVAKREADTYCRYLEKAGYLHKLNGGLFSLVRAMHTGPKPPMIQRVKQVYDPNLGRVVWSQFDGAQS